MNKKTKQMIVVIFAIIGLVCTLVFLTNNVVVPTAKFVLNKIDKAAAVEICKNNRNPHKESVNECLKKMGH